MLHSSPFPLPSSSSSSTTSYAATELTRGGPSTSTDLALDVGPAGHSYSSSMTTALEHRLNVHRSSDSSHRRSNSSLAPLSHHDHTASSVAEFHLPIALSSKTSSASTNSTSSLSQKNRPTASDSHFGGIPDKDELEDPAISCNVKFKRFMTHLVTNAVVALLLLVDAVLVIIRTAKDITDGPLIDVAITLTVIFLLEICLRFAALRTLFFKKYYLPLDSLLCIFNFLFTFNFFSISLYINGVTAIGVQSFRIFFRLFFFIYKDFASSARQLVSTNKARYTMHGFDLDLTYITDTIIAMGLPSVKLEAVYRNPISEVARFFKQLHPKHFLIINLCSERSYPAEPFEGRVVRLPFDDHNPCPLLNILYFCAFVRLFLSQNKENVVAVHCKGGKGRTGMVISSYLLFIHSKMYSEQALKHFAFQRTATDKEGKSQGVSGPSQLRYVKYMEELRFVAAGCSAKHFTADIANTLLTEAHHFLANGPKAELVTLKLHNVLRYRGKEKRRKLTTDKDIDDYNNAWNNNANWSLLITHYRPVAYATPIDLPAQHEDGTVNADHTNEVNRLRYEEFQDFFFKPRPRDAQDEHDDEQSPDTSIIFDLTSFSERALILGGDLKFTVFRGDLSLLEERRTDITEENSPQVFCFFWIHTAFLSSSSQELILRKGEIDEAHKDVTLDPEFHLILNYHTPPRVSAQNRQQIAPVKPSTEHIKRMHEITVKGHTGTVRHSQHKRKIRTTEHKKKAPQDDDDDDEDDDDESEGVDQTELDDTEEKTKMETKKQKAKGKNGKKTKRRSTAKERTEPRETVEEEAEDGEDDEQDEEKQRRRRLSDERR